jgi:4-carboxymuconolactone decarboxylase
MTDDESYTAGMRVRRDVLGDAYVDQVVADDLTSGFQELITRYAWGSVWTRPGLDRRTRSCLTVAMLATLGHHDELAIHLGGALRNGVSRAELSEVLMQVAIYAGVPAANAAFAVARRVLGQDAFE